MTSEDKKEWIEYLIEENTPIVKTIMENINGTTDDQYDRAYEIIIMVNSRLAYWEV